MAQAWESAHKKRPKKRGKKERGGALCYGLAEVGDSFLKHQPCDTRRIPNENPERASNSTQKGGRRRGYIPIKGSYEPANFVRMWRG